MLENDLEKNGLLKFQLYFVHFFEQRVIGQVQVSLMICTINLMHSYKISLVDE